MNFFKVVSINYSTIFNMQMDKNGSIYGVGGSDFYLLQILADHFPFRYEILNRVDYNYGLLKNGEWTGMIGMVIKGEADMAFGWISSTTERLQAVDFSFPYLMDSEVFFTAAPGLKQREFPFLDPFQLLVWYLLLLSLPISSAFVHILSSYNKHKVGFARGWIKESYNFLALFLGQGSYGSYRKVRVQIFMYHWSISKVVLVFGYCGTLLSFLMVPQRESPLKDVHELKDAVASGRYQFGTFKGTSLMGNLMAADSGALKYLADHIRRHPENALQHFDDAVQRAEAEKFAVLVMRQHMVIAASRLGAHRFHVPKDQVGLNPVCACVVLRKGSPERERIDVLIRRVIESGLYTKQIDDEIFRAHLKAPPETVVNERPLSFVDIETAVQLLGYGLVISAGSLALEIGFYRCQKRKEIL